MSTRVISFHYTLKNQEGQTLDSSDGREPLSFLEGTGQIIPGLESVLALMNVGDKRNIKVEAAQAYGQRNPELIVKVPRTKLPAGDLKVGDQFQAGSPDGGFGIFTVVEIATEEVSLDGNHPLAGVDLFFDVEIMAARPATDEEKAHGHAHGEGGHHH